MKKQLLLLALTLMIAIVSCKKEKPAPETVVTPTPPIAVSSTYKTLLVEYTATWCSPCGSYGYDNFKDAYDKNPGKVVGISMHANDAVSSGFSYAQDAMEKNWSFNATPMCAINNIRHSASGLQTEIDNAINSNPKAKAGIGIEWSVSGTTITINTRTVFFQSLTGEYNLGIYLVENGVMAYQTSHTPSFIVHDRILRDSPTSGGFGEKIVLNPSSEQSINKSYSYAFTAEVYNPSNLKVVAVIWKMSGNSPVEIINANEK